MKITALELFHISIPFAKPYKLSKVYGTRYNADAVIVSKNGGLSKARKIAATADAFGLKILMNSMLEFGITQAASLQLGCVLPNLLDMGHAYMSVLRMSDDITDFGQNISQATVTVPSGNGLGVRVNEEKLKKYTKDYLKLTE